MGLSYEAAVQVSAGPTNLPVRKTSPATDRIIQRPRATGKEVAVPLMMRLNGTGNGCCGSRAPGFQGASGNQDCQGFLKPWFFVQGCPSDSGAWVATGLRQGSRSSPGWKETCDRKGRSQAAAILNRIWGKGKGMT